MRLALLLGALLLATPSFASTAPSFRFTSASQVHAGKPIAKRFTCDGADVAPRLAWGRVPRKAKQLALVLEDPDAPGGTFTHWLVWGIPRTLTTLSRASRFPEGTNTFGKIGYDGPCPPTGQTHHYVFRVLALDVKLKLRQGADRLAFDRAVDHHVLAQARLVAPYARR